MAQTLQQFLIENGFVSIPDKNVLFRRDSGKEIELIQVTRIDQDCYATPSDYIRKNQQLMLKQAEPGKEVRILNLVLVTTLNAWGVREIAEQVPDVWILDDYKNRIVLFENQPRDFGGLYNRMERWIQDWDGQTELRKKDEGEKDFKKSPITVSIFFINFFLYFLLSHFGDVYDTEYMIKVGANQWRLVLEQHEYYRLFTCMFLHFGIDHLINNMYVFLLVGEQLERQFSRGKYLALYFGSGLVASIVSTIAHALMHANVVSAGASGAIYGLLGAVIASALLNKEERKKISFGRVILLLVGIFWLSTAKNQVDQFAHVGGFITGFVLCVVFFVLDKKKKLAQEKLFD